MVFLANNLLFAIICRFELFLRSHLGALLQRDSEGSAVALAVSCCWLTV